MQLYWLVSKYLSYGLYQYCPHMVISTVCTLWKINIDPGIHWGWKISFH